MNDHQTILLAAFFVLLYAFYLFLEAHPAMLHAVVAWFGGY